PRSQLAPVTAPAPKASTPKLGTMNQRAIRANITDTMRFVILGGSFASHIWASKPRGMNALRCICCCARTPCGRSEFWVAAVGTALTPAPTAASSGAFGTQAHPTAGSDRAGAACVACGPPPPPLLFGEPRGEPRRPPSHDRALEDSPDRGRDRGRGRGRGRDRDRENAPASAEAESAHLPSRCSRPESRVWWQVSDSWPS